VPPFPWLSIGLLAFWCVVAGIFIGEFLPLPPMPRGSMLAVLALVLVLGVVRAVWGMRVAIDRWRAAVRAADRG
jgi:hypothetical protein